MSIEVETTENGTTEKPKRSLPPLPLPMERVFDGPLTQEMLLSPGKFGLGMVPDRLSPDATTSMVCGFCSTGCSLNVHLKDGQAINLSPEVDYPVNTGMACPKGWEALTPLYSDDRGTTPLLGNKGSKLKPVDWATAMETFCERFKSIQAEHGNESVAFLGTGQMPTEELAFLGALAKFGMGMKHGDGNTRQCMATAVTAYKQSFGFDAPPYTYDDFEQSDVLVFVGANPCTAHPIMWQRVMRNPHSPKIIVIDPRHTETAACASHHLAIEPKSDMSLLYGIGRILIENGWIDRDFIDRSVNDFDAFESFVHAFDADRVERDSGISPERQHEIAQLIHEGQRVSFWWTMGVNQSYQGTRTAQAIINLALITGNIGRPGTGANSITGQCNAMGSRLFSNTTSLLGGHDFAKEEHRQKVADILGIDPAVIPTEASDSYDRIMDGIAEGRIRGLWVIATNPAHSWIHQERGRELLKKLDFLVVQDMYSTTETAEFADLYLPAAAWGEKEGTFINSERRFGLLKKVSRAPGQALSDFSIFQLVAHYWGVGDQFAEWTDAESVLKILARISEGQPCDITGIQDYRMLDDRGGIQWPYPASNANDAQERRLFEDGRFYHSDQKAKLIFDDPKEMPETTSEAYPFVLMTGRGSAAQWHTQTRTGKSKVLSRLYEVDPFVEIHPDDAKRLELTHDQLVSIESRRGKMTAKARIIPGVGRGRVFVPMHYEDVNQLTLGHFDPYSRQPSYKDCAVKIAAV
jgi:assimilatory nitrate reductase catalytic subunit